MPAKSRSDKTPDNLAVNAAFKAAFFAAYSATDNYSVNSTY
jgi:hypothetical protein